MKEENRPGEENRFLQESPVPDLEKPFPSQKEVPSGGIPDGEVSDSAIFEPRPVTLCAALPPRKKPILSFVSVGIVLFFLVAWLLGALLERNRSFPERAYPSYEEDWGSAAMERWDDEAALY